MAYRDEEEDQKMNRMKIRMIISNGNSTSLPQTLYRHRTYYLTCISARRNIPERILFSDNIWRRSNNQKEWVMKNVKDFGRNRGTSLYETAICSSAAGSGDHLLDASLVYRNKGWTSFEIFMTKLDIEENRRRLIMYDDDINGKDSTKTFPGTSNHARNVNGVHEIVTKNLSNLRGRPWYGLRSE